MTSPTPIPISIRVDNTDFNVSTEYDKLLKLVNTDNTCGAVAMFSGLVRADKVNHTTQAGAVETMFLEHYPAMTQKALQAISDEACLKFPLMGITIIHRVGELSTGDQIVFVGVASAHRSAAFSACEFIMDVLKTSAPFWKKENAKGMSHWVEAKASDDERLKKWEK